MRSFASGGTLVTKAQNSSFSFQHEFTEWKQGKGGIWQPEKTPGYYTLQFSVGPDNPPNVPLGASIPPAQAVFNGYDATATINWKVNGQAIQRMITIGQGTSISGLCESVDVLVADTTQIAAVNAGANYRVTVSAGPGTRAGYIIPPQLKGICTGIAGGGTILNGGIGIQQIAAGGGQVFYAIPQNAGVVSVEIDLLSAVNAAAQVEAFLSTVGPAMKAFNPPDNAYPLFVAIPPNATILELVNNDPTNVIDVTVTWGIDG